MQSLLNEISVFHEKLEDIINTSKIHIENEAEFIFYVKDHKSDKNLILPVLIYLCDTGYIFDNIGCKGKSLNGKIARYVILKMDISKLRENIINISKRNYDEIHMKQKIKELIKITYDKCNVFEEQFVPYNITRFIYRNIEMGTINKNRCFKEMRLGNCEYERYIRKVLREVLGYSDDKFIYNVEFVRDFYICLKKIIQHEFRQESLKIITEYMCNNYFEIAGIAKCSDKLNDRG